mmetsp:Transcript_145387/g.270707  ORF Transcript_145387/g.270707 Transcript_145387/m.270707 type:complete len:222 (+) Transcript_145387:1803-2468(+)
MAERAVGAELPAVSPAARCRGVCRAAFLSTLWVLKTLTSEAAIRMLSNFPLFAVIARDNADIQHTSSCEARLSAEPPIRSNRAAIDSGSSKLANRCTTVRPAPVVACQDRISFFWLFQHTTPGAISAPVAKHLAGFASANVANSMASPEGLSGTTGVVSLKRGDCPSEGILQPAAIALSTSGLVGLGPFVINRMLDLVTERYKSRKSKKSFLLDALSTAYC